MAEELFRNRTQGTERWLQVPVWQHDERRTSDTQEPLMSYSDEKGDSFSSIRDTVSSYHDRSEQKFYYVEQNHLLVSDFNHTETECLYGIPDSDHIIRLLTVNDRGIFLSEESEGFEESDDFEGRDKVILWLTHDGKLRKKIIIKGRIKQTYICSNLIFYRREEHVQEGKVFREGNLHSAYWMNMDTETEQCIIMASAERLRKDATFYCSRITGNYKGVEEENCKFMDVEYLMGNEQGAVFRLHCYAYGSTDGGDVIELDYPEGWYYYGFSIQKSYCLSRSDELRPHLAYLNPQKYLYCERYLKEFGVFPSDKGKGNNVVKRRDIVAFNMEENLMWLFRYKNGKEYWMPIDISTEPEKHIRTDLPVWYIPDDIWKMDRRYYFDGERLYYYGDRHMCSLNADGRVEEWPIETLPSYIGIFRFGDYVFVQGGENRYDQCFICPATHSFREVLSIWPHIGAWGPRDQKENDWQLIKAFDEDYRTGGKSQSYEDEWKITAIGNEVENGKRGNRESGIKEEDRGSRTGEESRQADQTGIPASQLEYWAGFRAYAVKKGLSTGFKLPEAADHNWYAIRLGSATFRIECSVNARKETIRAAFFVKKAPDVFDRLVRAKTSIEAGMGRLGEIVWDGESQAANVSIIAPRKGKDTTEQYEWFCHAVEKMYAAVSPYLGL